MVVSELTETEKEVLVNKYVSMGFSKPQVEARLNGVLTQLRVPLLEVP